MNFIKLSKNIYKKIINARDRTTYLAFTNSIAYILNFLISKPFDLVFKRLDVLRALVI